MPALGWLHRYVTLTMSRGLKPTDLPDQYQVRIMTGTSPNMKKVDAAAVREIEKFRAGEGAAYTSYEIVKRKWVFFPTAYDYTVKFTK